MKINLINFFQTTVPWTSTTRNLISVYTQLTDKKECKKNACYIKNTEATGLCGYVWLCNITVYDPMMVRIIVLAVFLLIPAKTFFGEVLMYFPWKTKWMLFILWDDSLCHVDEVLNTFVMYLFLDLWPWIMKRATGFFRDLFLVSGWPTNKRRTEKHGEVSLCRLAEVWPFGNIKEIMGSRYYFWISHSILQIQIFCMCGWLIL